VCYVSFLFGILVKGHCTYTCFESCVANLFLSFKKIKKIVQFVEVSFQGLLKGTYNFSKFTSIVNFQVYESNLYNNSKDVFLIH
jgi:hypothetical protein